MKKTSTHVGTPTTWKDERDFGFLRHDDKSSTDAFLHVSELIAAGIPSPPRVGARFAFDIGFQASSGKPYAKGLKPVDG